MVRVKQAFGVLILARPRLRLSGAVFAGSVGRYAKWLQHQEKLRPAHAPGRRPVVAQLEQKPCSSTCGTCRTAWSWIKRRSLTRAGCRPRRLRQNQIGGAPTKEPARSIWPASTRRFAAYVPSESGRKYRFPVPESRFFGILSRPHEDADPPLPFSRHSRAAGTGSVS